MTTGPKADAADAADAGAATAGLHAAPTYRPDIDGLRAIAILAVVIFHAFPSALRGGFVGVDVFFVISGFLISSIIFKNLQQGTFNLTDFYARRIRRIFPALALVLGAAYVVGWFTLLPDEFKQLGKHMAAGVAFVQNFALWREAGYFDAASELKPLMHLWSLAIEEQFYLIYPLLIWAAWRSVNVLVILALFGLVSFGCNVVGVQDDAARTFFLPQARFWELSVGSVLAYLQLRRGELLRAPVRASAAGLGLALLAVSVLAIDRSAAFPGWYALAPTLGAALLICSGPQTWVHQNLLANRFMVWVGLISYPLYLWHWPLLSFLRILAADALTPVVRLLALGASVLLAWLTYRWIEKPIRLGHPTKRVVLALCVLLMALGALGFKAYRDDGLAYRSDASAEFSRRVNANHLSAKMEEKYRDQCSFYDPRPGRSPKANVAPECITPTSDQRVFLWGDSHAQQFYFGLRTVLPPEISILQVATNNCKPSLRPQQPDAYGSCNISNRTALEQIEKLKPQVVVLAQVGEHEKTDFAELAAALKHRGVQRVVLAGPVPQWEPDLKRLIARNRALFQDKPRRLAAHLKPQVFATNQQLVARYGAAPDLTYVSMTAALCNAQGCLTYLGERMEDGLTTFDYGHLTPVASIYVAQNALAPVIRDVFGLEPVVPGNLQ